MLFECASEWGIQLVDSTLLFHVLRNGLKKVETLSDMTKAFLSSTLENALGERDPLLIIYGVLALFHISDMLRTL